MGDSETTGILRIKKMPSHRYYAEDIETKPPLRLRPEKKRKSKENKALVMKNNSHNM